MPPPGRYQQPHLQPPLQPAQPGVTILHTANGTPEQVANVNQQEDDLANCRATPAKVLAALQIFSAIVIVICQIMLVKLYPLHFIGFWAPVTFILAGAFGIQSSKTKSSRTVITTMILSMIAALFGFGVFGVANQAFLDYVNYINKVSPIGEAWTVDAFCWTMMIFGIFEGIVALIAAYFCCLGCFGIQGNQGVSVSQGVSVTQGSVQMPAVQYQNNPGFSPGPLAQMPAVQYQNNPGFSPGPLAQMPAVQYQNNPGFSPGPLAQMPAVQYQNNPGFSPGPLAQLPAVHNPGFSPGPLAQMPMVSYPDNKIHVGKTGQDGH